MGDRQVRWLRTLMLIRVIGHCLQPIIVSSKKKTVLYYHLSRVARVMPAVPGNESF
jgi:hypothetical protein